MEYIDKIRQVLLRYPHKDQKVRVYIEPSISGCDHDWLSNLDTYFIEVSTPEEADYIPIWVDYKHRCSNEILSWIDKYPNKCLSSFNLIESVNAEMPELNEEIFESIKNMLSSPDWEQIYLGLGLLRSYYLNDDAKILAKMIIDSGYIDCEHNQCSVIPLGKEANEAVTVQNLDIIKFYHIWLHNTFLVI